MSIITDYGKIILPRSVMEKLRQKKIQSEMKKVEKFGKMSEKELIKILTNKLDIQQGDTVLVHSSTDILNLEIPVNRLLKVLKEIVGDEGTTIYPTYPKSSSYDFLKNNELFNVKRTPSYTGMLTELARRDPSAIRSIHPTKSVCALGPNAKKITDTHHLSLYPYDKKSPYYKIMNFDTKIIGLGVTSSICTYLHSVEDELEDKFPVNVYHKRWFEAKCIDYNGNDIIVQTLAHNTLKMNHDFSRFQRKYISNELCQEFIVNGRPFYRIHSSKLFMELVFLAEKGITMYPLRSYKIGRIYKRSIN